MAMLLRDRELERRLIADRRRRGIDLFDEVWNGVYVMSPPADDGHQEVSTRLAGALEFLVGLPDGSRVRAAISISDRVRGWTKNFRVPDVAVFLPGTAAVNHGAFWHGGPDFAVEILSKGDRARLKLPFYAEVGTREVLLIDRNPWALELYRRHEGRLTPIGRATLEGGEALASEVLPLAFRLVVGDAGGRPRIEVRRTDAEQTWRI